MAQKYKPILTLFLFILISIASFSNRLMFERLQVPVSHSNVISITQDKQGFMWFGTRNGLNRYDGVNMLAFHHQSFNDASLINNLVNSTKIDKEGLLWVGTYDGLSIFDPQQFRFGSIDKFIPVKEKPDFGNVLSIEVGIDNDMWVATSPNGLYRINKATGDISRFTTDKNSGGICSELVNSVMVDSKGRIWVGTRNGLSVIEKGCAQVSNYINLVGDHNSLSDNYITSIVEDINGVIWVATASMGLHRVNENLGRILFERMPFYNKFHSYNPGFSILALMSDKEGNLWIGTENGGLYIIKENGAEIERFMNDPFDSKSLAGNSIYNIFQSSDGIVWIGTYNQGVCYFDPNKIPFEHYYQNPTNSNILNCNIINYMQFDGTRLFVGTDGGGLIITDPALKSSAYFTKTASPSSISSNTIMCMYSDPLKGLWIGTWGGGLNLFDKKKNSFKHYSSVFDRNEETDIENVTSIYEDSKGRLWVGTFSFGLNYYSPETDRLIHFSGRDAGNSIFDTENIRCILETADGELLLGTMDGLYRIKNPYLSPVISRYRYERNNPNSLSNNLVVSLFEDMRGRIWVGTIGGGLNLFDMKEGAFTRFSEKEGLPENTIRSMIADGNGDIWISTNSGIARMQSATLEIEAYRSKVLRDMDEFLFNSAVSDDKGFIYFGGSNGFIRFNPQTISKNKNIPQLVFSDFRLFNESVEIGGKKSPLKKHISATNSITLEHKQSVISIDFVALNYTEPGQNMYAYYLEGFDDDWYYSGQNNTATYTNLDPGKYIFKVKASNNDGVWNTEPASLIIRIKSPLWAAWWAFSLYIIFLTFLFYFVLRIIRKRAIEQEQLRVERLQNQNMQELKDRKLQFFTNISHEIRTPLSLIMTPLEEVLHAKGIPDDVKKKITYANENSKFLLKLVNQLLDFRKLDNRKMELLLAEESINQVVHHIIELHRLKAEEKSIEIVFEPIEAEMKFLLDVEKIEKIIQNLLSNAIKFSPNHSLIFVRIINEKQSNHLIVEVIDHGPGIEAEQIPLIFERFFQGKTAVNKGGTGIGLALCKELTEIHKGKLQVDSKLGEGSCFRLIIPTDKESYLEENIIFSIAGGVNAIMPDEDISKTLVDSSNEPDGRNIRHTMVIVEDEVQILNYLLDEFSKSFKVFTASNGKEALKVITKNLPDIIISDVLMPEMDGMELCREVKKDIETSHIPFIMLTAKIDIENQIDGLETGADAYVTKPFNMRYLKVLIKNTIEKRSNMYKTFSQKNIIIPSEFSTNKMDEEFLHKVISYIETNIENTDLSVDMLAQNMNLSRSQVYRKIKALTDLTANEFIRQIRLKKSLKFLSEGNMNISEIAYSVGFSSQSYFTRSFKEYYGKSPSELRNQ
jgi:signal transduction histidine kinase/ligand-binding sensor domain-containing protein/DNA-binding response OmpR family regulator